MLISTVTSSTTAAAKATQTRATKCNFTLLQPTNWMSQSEETQRIWAPIRGNAKMKVREQIP